MERKRPRLSRAQKSIRKLIDFKAVGSYGVETYSHGELAFFSLRPSNLSVLSPESLVARVNALVNVLKGVVELTMLCLSSREDYAENRRFLRERIEVEENETIRGQLRKDIALLDAEQGAAAATREFYLVVNLRTGRSRGLKPLETAPFLSHVERLVREQGFDTRRAEMEDIMRIMSVYFTQSAGSGRPESFDGEHFISPDWR